MANKIVNCPQLSIVYDWFNACYTVSRLALADSFLVRRSGHDPHNIDHQETTKPINLTAAVGTSAPTHKSVGFIDRILTDS